MIPNWLTVLMPFLSAIVGAVVGGLVVHRLALSRDARNEQRGRRVEHLLSAYQRLIAAANREGGNNDAQKAGLEAAISDVMLLGQTAEVEAARRFLVALGGTGGATLDPLLIALRDSLRSELGLDTTPMPDPYTVRMATD